MQQAYVNKTNTQLYEQILSKTKFSISLNTKTFRGKKQKTALQKEDIKILFSNLRALHIAN